MATKKFIDIGANLTDSMFQGIYFGNKKHVPDVNNVVQRAIQAGMEKIIVTGGSLEDSIEALKLAKNDPKLFCTAGFHPTRCLEMDNDPQTNIDNLINLCRTNTDKIVAVGEFGLDYDRLEFCPKDVQIRNFTRQLDVAEQTKLPLFLHCRNAASDLLDILKNNRNRFTTGVVHSFDGTYEEANSFIDLGLYIGLNGCSLKTEQNLEVVKRLPIEKLMIETDCPYCEIKATHASSKYVLTKLESVKKEKWSPEKMVKGRNEPVNIVQVLEVIAAIKKMNQDQLSQILYENTIKVFFSLNSSN